MIATTAIASAQEQVDEWGVTPRDWSVLNGVQFRAKIGAESRQAEILHKADLGDAKAMVIAGGALSSSLWGKPDLERSYFFARQAAEAGNARGMLLLHQHLSGGWIAQKNDTEALKWVWRAAHAGNALSMLYLGGAYFNGSGVTKDSDQALAWYGKSVAAGCDYAALYAARVLIEKGKITEAFEQVKIAASTGDFEAVYEYALYLADKKWSGDEADAARSLQIIKEVADEGLATARKDYVHRLVWGMGVARDFISAEAYLDPPSEQDTPGYLIDRGVINYSLYYRDKSVKSRKIAAMENFKKAATSSQATDSERGHAKYYMGALLEYENPPAARELFTQAASLGLTDAQTAVNEMDSAAQKEKLAADARAKMIAQAEAAVRIASAGQTASLGVAGAPSSTDILMVHAKLNAKYWGGRLTSTPGEQIVPSEFGGDKYTYRRSVANASCRKLSAISFRCSYDLTRTQTAAADSFWGALTTAAANAFGGKPTNHWTYTYVKRGGLWTSDEMDRENSADYTAWTASQRQRSSTGSGTTTQPCTGSVEADWTGGNGMISGMKWNPNGC